MGSRKPETLAYHYLYKTLSWRKLRLWQLEREPDCRMCRVIGRQTKATTADHIEPHRGNRALFWNRKNLQSLCDIHHNEKIRIEEGGKPKAVIGNDGWPIIGRAET